MKPKIILLLMFLSTTLIFTQNEKDYFTTINKTKIGGYIGLGARYSTVTNSNNVGFLDYKAALTFNGKWGIGLSGSGLLHNHRKLRTLVSDGTYQLYVSYGALFIERIFTLNNDFKFSISISTGKGETSYIYDKDYRKDKVWSEETIDKTDFYVFEPGLEVQHKIYGNWWIGLNLTYRNTSPIELINTDESFLRKSSAGINFKYGIF